MHLYLGIYWSAAIALALTAVLTLTLRPLAIRLQLTDSPGGRKQHIGEIPLVGGIAMLIGIIVSLAVRRAIELLALPVSRSRSSSRSVSSMIVAA